MGAVNRRPVKPLQANPIRLSQPLGATLAFLGVDRCMPLMHGAQGCTSFAKVFFTRHFCEPIAIQTTAVTDVTAILDGGDHFVVLLVGIAHRVGNATGDEVDARFCFDVLHVLFPRKRKTPVLRFV
jgi:hypothetical protein